MRIATAHLRRRAAFALALLLTFSTVPTVAVGVPSTPQIEAKQAEAAAAQAELERMNVALEVQVEQYNAISEALDQTREQVRLIRVDLESANTELAESRRTLGDRAATIYKDGGAGAMDVFLGARSFDEFMLRLDLAVRISRSDANIVIRVKDAKARVEAAAQALEQRLSEQVTLQAEASARAEAIEADVQKQERFVSALGSEVRDLIAAEEEHQRQLALERARQAALAAAASASRNTGTTGGRTAADPGTLKSGHPEVVAVALQHLGTPYVWGGTTPAGFDCSGLTQHSYRQVGVILPRTSQSQFQAGQYIARDRLDLLQAGDLVFFGTDGDAGRIHHVGLYVGEGNYVHAPYTGAVVRVDSLISRIESRSDYVGASRF